jgi:L-arabinose isomerase
MKVASASKAAGEIASRAGAARLSDVNALLAEYEEQYALDPALRKDGELRDALLRHARTELGLIDYLESGGFGAFTTDPPSAAPGAGAAPGSAAAADSLAGLPVQRAMAAGFGYAGRGDAQTAGLVRTIKAMSSGLGGGTTFLEDHTYTTGTSGMLVVGASILEICPSVAAAPVRLVAGFSHQSQADSRRKRTEATSSPARLVFTGAPARGRNVALVEVGGTTCLLVNEAVVVAEEQGALDLPVPRLHWEPLPDRHRAAECWSMAGGTRHSCFTTAADAAVLAAWAVVNDLPLLVIDRETVVRAFRRQLRGGAW